jgi:alkanesulfonate monooxygenase SsuD/methylene tetrahydromethanopterin reductase-like flavin-dependent oxidoreductase (luciferase family)
VTADLTVVAAPTVAATTPLRIDLFLAAGQLGDLDAAAALRACTAYAVAAEEAGFDGVWLAEHHFISYGVCPSAVALGAYLLGRTRNITIGTAAAILSNRHPVALAEEAALLDAVAPGRFALGVARGGPWVDLEVFGTGLDRYERGFAESLDLLLLALSGAETISASGPTFSFRPVPLVPRPPRRLPVWVAATSGPTAALAAGRGLPLLLGMHDDLAAKASMLDAYARRHPVPVGHASVHLVSLGSAEALHGHLKAWQARTRDYQRIGPAPSTGRDLDAYVERLLRLHPPGPLDQVYARLAEAADVLGVHRLLLSVEAAGSPADVLTTIEGLGAQVLPRLRARQPATPRARR